MTSQSRQTTSISRTLALLTGCMLLPLVAGCFLFESNGNNNDSDGGTVSDGATTDASQSAGPTAIQVLGTGTPSSGTTGQLTLSTGVGLVNATVGTEGGRVEASDGLVIEVPAMAHDTATQYIVESYVIDSHSFGDDIVAISPLYEVKNGGVKTNLPLTLEIPAAVPEGQMAMAFYYDEASGKIEGLPLLEIKPGSIVTSTRHFSKFMVITIKGLVVGQVPAPKIDTGFRPGVDDWSFVNRGSAIESGGHCSGQSVSALWYYVEQRINGGQPTLYNRHDNTDGKPNHSPWPATPSFWQDDRDGYRLASAVQRDQYYPNMGDYEWKMDKIANARVDALQYSAFGMAMHITGEPQYVGIMHYNKGKFDGGHAMIVYGLDERGLFVADPNYPETFRVIPWDANKEVLGPYNSALKAGGAGIAFEVIGYYAKSAVIDWDDLGGRWSEFLDGTAGDDLFPAYTIKATGTDSSGKSISFDLTGDTVITALDEVELTAEVPGKDFQLTVYDGTQQLGKTSTAVPAPVAVKLDDGDNELGFLVESSEGKTWDFLDFDRLTLVKGAGINTTMLPNQGQAGGMSMLIKVLPTANTDSGTGQVTSVTATYKAPPAADKAADPADVCMGTGYGGASAGFGPNICISVTLTMPQPPCTTCFDLAAVRTEFGAPDVCNHVDVTRYPCVESAGGSYDRGVQIKGFVEEDRNKQVANFKLRAEVMGVRIDMSAAYRTLSPSQDLVDHMQRVVKLLGDWVAAEVRSQL